MAKVHKKIVIMGATSGIGLRLAVTLASKGWTVGAAGRKLAVLEKLKSKFPTVVEIEQIDIKEKDAPKKLIRLIRKLGGMDIYFHDSGVGYENVSLEIAEEVNTLETNVVGFARMIATAYHYYRLTGFHGQIAAITSVAGTKGYGPLASYSSSKKFGQTYLWALDQLARQEGVDVAFTDIRPGWVRTPLLENSRNYPMCMNMNQVVRSIIRALLHETRVKTIDWRWNILSKIWDFIPYCLWVNMSPSVSSPASPSQEKKNAKMSADKF